jgi:hypothetical protein
MEQLIHSSANHSFIPQRPRKSANALSTTSDYLKRHIRGLNFLILFIHLYLITSSLHHFTSKQLRPLALSAPSHLTPCTLHLSPFTSPLQTSHLRHGAAFNRKTLL